MADQTRTSFPADGRAAGARLNPPLGAILISNIIGGLAAGQAGGRGPMAVLLGGLGLISWFIGLRWYGLPGMGLRGRRPLFAGIGFAALGWLVFLLSRFWVEIVAVGSGETGRAFVYFLLFEAFSVQLWAFGLVFRTVAGWRGPMTAVLVSAAVFGLVAFLTFEESYVPAAGALFYFLVWGFLYGLIRLRTGSLMGMVLVQAMQSLTAWHVFVPAAPPDPAQLQRLYFSSAMLYLVLIWRLWPKVKEDYRI
ncbi:MAG: CPBP family glutamic-type intramembrane protease [Chloroflexota bacterium]